MHPCHPFYPFTNGSGKHRSYSYVSNEEEAYHSAGIYVHKIERGPPRMSEPIRPHENDVLLGRGGKNNQHSGNEKLREIARGHSDDYRTSTKKGKSYISRQLVQKMRELTPPSRFLKRNTQTGEWEDVGDDTAREKASQVLRDAVALLPEEQGAQPQHHPRGRAETPDDEDQHPYLPSVASVARVSTDESERQPSQHNPIYSQATGLQPVLHSSLPPPTPVAGTRKRQRYAYNPYDPYSTTEPHSAPPSPNRRRHSSVYQHTSHNSGYMPPPSVAGSYPQPVMVAAHPQMPLPHLPPPQHYAGHHHHHQQPPPYAPQHQYQYPQQYPPQHVPQYHPHQPPPSSQMMMGRPMMAARNSSTASAHSLLGDLQAGTSNEFDLFNGELLESDHEDQRGGAGGNQEQRRQQPPPPQPYPSYSSTSQQPDAQYSEYRGGPPQQYAAPIEPPRGDEQQQRTTQSHYYLHHQYPPADSQQSRRDTV